MTTMLSLAYYIVTREGGPPPGCSLNLIAKRARCRAKFSDVLGRAPEHILTYKSCLPRVLPRSDTLPNGIVMVPSLMFLGFISAHILLDLLRSDVSKLVATRFVLLLLDCTPATHHLVRDLYCLAEMPL
ncbi:hypothetical protein DAEQUDRAFT_256001 [Daedalea quercina L-15889]|uniref:Uncharacterized protein n=1 Tax=Daedalea quercina L-15889 TaxID=1314783 RepID=A0A165QIW4_9APHY|nr:hypothetical protein DAEQUDRAFT_256001 [Daedalea quercina L-15889]